MKKRLTRGEKWLFASPLLFLVLVGAYYQSRRIPADSIELPQYHRTTKLIYSPDGKRLLVFVAENGTNRATRRVYDVKTHRPICELATLPASRFGFPKNSEVWVSFGNVSWSPDETRLVTSVNILSRSKSVDMIRVWNARTGAIITNKLYSPEKYRNGATNLNFSADGKTLLSASSPPAIYDPNTGKRLNKPTLRATKDAWAELNEKLGLMVSYDENSRRFKVTDSKTGRVVWERRIKSPSTQWKGDILCVMDNIYYQSETREGENALFLWNGKTRQLMPSPPIFRRGEIGGVTFNSDGRTLAYFVQHGSEELYQQHTGEGELTVWDYRTHRVLWRYVARTELFSPGWSPDGKWLTALDNYKNHPYGLYIFDKSGQLRFQRSSVDHPYEWSPDSKQLAIVQARRGWNHEIKSSYVEFMHF